MVRDVTGTHGDGRMPAGRIAATLVLTLLAGAAVASGIAAGVPADIADVRTAGLLVALAGGALLGAVATGHRDPSGGARTATHVRVVEGVALVVLARLSWLVGRPAAEAAAVLRGWGVRPVSVVDLELVVLVGVAVAGWGAVVTTLRDLAAAEARGRVRVTGDPLERLTRRFLLATVAVALGVGLTARAGGPALTATLAALTYLVVAVAGLARVRLGSLRTRWGEVGTVIDEEVTGRWRRTSALLILAAVVLALVLPTPAGIGAVGLVFAAVRAVVRGTAGVFERLGRIERAPEEPTAPEIDWRGWDPFGEGTWRGPRELLPHGLLPPPVESAVPYLAVAVAGVLVFLLLLKAVDAGEQAGVRARRRPRGPLRRLLAALRPGRLLGRLRDWLSVRLLTDVWQRLAGTPPAGSDGVRPRRRPETGGARPGRRGDHRPRQRVLDAYAAVLGAAAERGVPRRASQTPYEFEAALARVVSGERGTLDRLTDRFVEARFSAHPIDEEGATRAVEEAERLRAALAADGQAGASPPSGPSSPA